MKKFRNLEGFHRIFLILYLLLAVKLPSVHSYQDEDEPVLEPENPTLEIGQTLLLNCTLSGSTRYLEELFIRSRDINYVAPFLVEISEDTVQLKIENVYFNHSGTYTCRLPNRPPGMRSNQHVIVTRKPLKPESIDCKFEKMRNLNCSWLPSYKNQQDYTQLAQSIDQILQINWTRANWSMIVPSQNSLSSCGYSLADVIEDINEEICVRVFIKNILQKEVYSDIKCFTISQIIYPESPRFEGMSELEEGCLLEWSQPFFDGYTSLPLVFYISLVHSFKGAPHINETIETYKVVNRTTLLLKSCHPYAHYLGHIYSASALGGFPSEPKFVEFHTDSTVPCQSVELSPYTLFISYPHKTMCIYWQAIPKKNYCGPNFQYTLLMRSTSHSNGNNSLGWKPVENISLATPYLQFHVQDFCLAQTCEFSVISKNDMGFQFENLSLFRWPDDENVAKNLVKVTNLIAERFQNSAYLSWDVNYEKNGSFITNTSTVVYWCPSLSRNICEDDLKWKVIEPDARHYNLSLDYSHELIYGVAVFLHGFSSEIVWSSRIYDSEGETSPPSQVAARNSADGGTGLTVYWSFNQDECLHCSYVTHFIIFYCHTVDQTTCSNNVAQVVVSNSLRIFTIPDLEDGNSHLIWMSSSSRISTSVCTDPIVTNPPRIWKKYVILISSVVIILCCLVLIIGLKFHNPTKCWKNFSSLKIILPQVLSTWPYFSSGNNGEYKGEISNQQHEPVNTHLPLLEIKNAPVREDGKDGDINYSPPNGFSNNPKELVTQYSTEPDPYIQSLSILGDQTYSTVRPTDLSFPIDYNPNEIISFIDERGRNADYSSNINYLNDEAEIPASPSSFKVANKTSEDDKLQTDPSTISAYCQLEDSIRTYIFIAPNTQQSDINPTSPYVPLTDFDAPTQKCHIVDEESDCKEV